MASSRHVVNRLEESCGSLQRSGTGARESAAAWGHPWPVEGLASWKNTGKGNTQVHVVWTRDRGQSVLVKEGEVGKVKKLWGRVRRQCRLFVMPLIFKGPKALKKPREASVMANPIVFFFVVFRARMCLVAKTRSNSRWMSVYFIFCLSKNFHLVSSKYSDSSDRLCT